MAKVELTVMVMIQDADGRVLVQDRVKSWTGLSFPGGHVESSESFAAAAAREVEEETGLSVTNLRHCGVVHWLNTTTDDRYLAFLYKTASYSGMLTTDCDEGRHCWMDIETLRQQPSTNGFDRYLPLFLDDSISEGFAPWQAGQPFEVTYL